MVMDMPPGQAEEYRLEAPAIKPLSSNGFENLVRLARARGEAAKAIGTDETARILPAMDPGSRALSDADRKSLAASAEAGPYGRLNEIGRDAPSSYVGDRVRLAALRAQALERSFQGNLKMEQAEALRCRTIAVAMDRRAGAYVVGGERTAEQARNAISPEAIAKCRETVAQQARQGHSRPAVGIMPDRSHGHAAAPQRIDPVGSSRQRIDPIGSHVPVIDPARSHRRPGVPVAAPGQRNDTLASHRIDSRSAHVPVIDPAVSQRQRIDPAASIKHRLDLLSPSRGG